jgi:hypothetical protein
MSPSSIVSQVRLVGYQVCVAADYLAAQSFGPCAEGTKAHRFCRPGCTYDTTSPHAGKPFSFYRECEEECEGENCPPSPSPARRRPAFGMIAWQVLKGVIKEIRALDVPWAKKKEVMRAYGLTKLVFPLDDEYIPDADCTADIPVDLLHLFPDGLLRSHCAWLFYILHKLGLDYDSVDRCVKFYPHWPPDVRIPPLHKGMRKGTRAGKPKSGTTMRMTGSQMHWFALHSPGLLDPLLTPQMRAHPAWTSWVKVVELYSVCVKHELEADDVKRIDDLQYEYCRLFDTVKEFAGLKRPKHHFLSHLAPDIWRFGPPRGFWCFGFEGFNKVIKAGAVRSNWKCETVSIMEYWAMRSAREVRRRERESVVHANECMQIV